MIPETEISKRGNSIFLVFDSRYYLASNATETNSDNVYLGGLTFPLVKARTLAEEEASYFRKNASTILGEAELIAAQIEKKEGTDELIQQLYNTAELNFFLKNIARADNPQSRIGQFQPQIIAQMPAGKLSLDGINITPTIITENVLAVNSRLYPLVGIDKPSIVFFGGRHYTLGSSKLSLEELAKQFQLRLAQELKLRVIARSSKCREVHQEIENLEGENSFLIKQLGVKANPFSYECGREGLDTSLRRVYALIDPHSNHTSDKSYAKGQSAVTLPISKGELGTDLKFADRPDVNHPFVIHSHSNCYGDLKLVGTTLEDKMFYLREAANTVVTQGGFYQLSTSSSDSSD